MIGERRRLDECAQEPIRIPGSIQPHGVLLVVDFATSTITRASDNTAAVFGIPTDRVLGQPLASVVDAHWLAENSDALSGVVEPNNPVPVTVNGRRFDAILHRADDSTLVEFEPATDAETRDLAPAVYRSILSLTKITTEQQLLDAAAREIRLLTGFDKVMIYHFHPDGHGEVVAEDRAPEMEPFLGLHFPASDIPTQARELYLTKLSRMIADSSGATSALLSSIADDDAALDLSDAELRSVSPFHLQFMRNMGQAATLSLSMIRDGRLIGMVTLAHRTPHHVPFIVRQGLEVLASQVALQLGAMIEIRRLTQHVLLRSVRAQLVSQIGPGQAEDAANIGHALVAGTATVLDLIDADGAMLQIGSHTSTIGTVPPEDTVRLAARLAGRSTFVTDSLAATHPEIAALLPSATGLLLVPIPGSDGFLAWFRREITEDVAWLGDQSPQNRVTPLSPRTSFAAWTQSVSGHSAPWEGLESEAEDLARDLAGTMLRDAEARLAALAMRDALTGLPNRRSLMEELDNGVLDGADGSGISMLFVDIDSFKSFNDTHGHDVGDEVLGHVARQILAITRPRDTVARLGGDEFVVVCRDTTREEAAVIAERIVTSIALPLESRGSSLSVSASVGFAVAGSETSGLELLRVADGAMYRAKARGRGQASE